MRLGLALRAATLGLMAGLAGCGGIRSGTAVGPVEVMLPALPDDCGAGDASVTLGQTFTLLADVPLAGPLRVLWPAQEITGDVQPDRLNARVSAEGRVLELFCG